MLKKRIIPCLDVSGDMVVKGIQFKAIKPIEDPYTLALYYDQAGADELVLYDISANIESRTITSKLIQKIAGALSIPLTVGGGVNSLEDCKRLFDVGADKVSINSGALKNPKLISEAASRYGSQSIVASVDVAFDADNHVYTVYARGGRENTGRSALDWIKQMVTEGAGEVVVNSIHCDGMKNGYDLDFLTQVSQGVNVPIIASGGAGSLLHFDEALQINKVTGALAASLFHTKALSIYEVKTYLKEKGHPMRCL